jgi:plastocyanin
MRSRRVWALRIGMATLAVALAFTTGVASAGGGNRVRAVNFAFKPHTITIQKGQRVTWKRAAGRHTVTFKKGSFDKTLSRNHRRVSRRFHHRGTFRYFCRFHRSLGMTGKVVVK